MRTRKEAPARTDQEKRPTTPARDHERAAQPGPGWYLLAFSAPASDAAGSFRYSAPAESGSRGRPLLPPERARFENALGAELSHVRLHDDAASQLAATRLGARAFTVGRDVYLGAEAQVGSRRDEVLAHELTHAAQSPREIPSSVLQVAARNHPLEVAARSAAFGQRTPSVSASVPLIFRDDLLPEPPAGFEASEDPDEAIVTPVDEMEDEALEALSAPPLNAQVQAAAPDLFLFEEGATAMEVAEYLFGRAERVDALDVISDSPIPGRRAFRVRDPGLLLPERRRLQTIAYEFAIRGDVVTTLEELREPGAPTAEQWRLVQRTLRWAQRSQQRDDNGVSWFDRYLLALEAVPLSRGYFSTTRTAREWLLMDTGDLSEQVKKAIELRSERFRGTSGYVIADGSPELSAGSVIGRFYWRLGSGVQIRVVERIANEPTRLRAEIQTRNAHADSMRVVVPARNGRWYGYAVEASRTAGRLLPTGDRTGEYFWYYPGTVYIPPRALQPEYAATDDPDIRALRVDLLQKAIAGATEADPGSLLWLDYDVLYTATVEQRAHMYEIVVKSAEVRRPAGIDFITRLVFTTPDDQFPAFEPHFTRFALVNRLLSGKQDQLRLLGQAFTLKTMTSMPLDAAALAGLGGRGGGLPQVNVGKEASEHINAGFTVPVEIESESIAPADWDLTVGPTAVRQPSLAGDAPGTRERTGIAIDTLRHKGSIFGGGPTPVRHGPYHPTQLILVNVHGPEPQLRIVTAFEAGLIASAWAEAMIWDQGITSVNALLWARAGLSLGRAFGPAMTRGLMAGGVRAALGAAVRHAGTQAGRSALRSFIVEAALLGSMQLVETYRTELSRTPEGRAFLALYDVAMLLLLARGLYRLTASGLVPIMVGLGRSALRVSSVSARAALLRLMDTLEAIQRAFQRLRSEGQLVLETNALGIRMWVPRSPAAFHRAYIAAQAEVAGGRMVAGLGGTAAGATARRVAELLARLTEQTEDLARMARDVSRRAAGLAPADAERFLQAVERALTTAGRPPAEIAYFVRASVRVADPVRFLELVQQLMTRQLSNESLRVLGRKALARSVELEWLSSTNLSDDLLEVLARDPKTPWRLFRAAALNPGDARLQHYAHARLRGIAGEHVTETLIQRILPNHRIIGRQIPMGSSIIDLEVLLMDSLGRTFALEVKAWGANMWRSALEAFRRRAGGAGLVNRTEQQVVRALDHLMGQLRNASAARSGRVYLAVSSALRGGDRLYLESLIRQRVRGQVRLVWIPEAEIERIAGRIGAGLGLP